MRVGSVLIYDRAASFVEIPVGFGWGLDLLPRWLTLRFEAMGSFLPSQDGDLLLQNRPGQAIVNGAIFNLSSPPPSPWAAFTGTLGLSLLL
jgi:hypothetical protein